MALHGGGMVCGDTMCLLAKYSFFLFYRENRYFEVENAARCLKPPLISCILFRGGGINDKYTRS